MTRAVNALVMPGLAGRPAVVRPLLLTLVLVPVVVSVTLPLVLRLTGGGPR